MTESFALDPFTLATDGVLRPVSDDPTDGYCPGLFSLASGGSWYIPEIAELGLADPYVGPSRFTEPFDRGYYLWRYGNQVLPKVAPGAEPERPEQVRRSFIFDSFQEEIESPADVERARAARDLRELELYAAELRAEIELDRVARDRLEDDLQAVHEVLLLIRARQEQRARNQQAAAVAVIHFYT